MDAFKNRPRFHDDSYQDGAPLAAGENDSHSPALEELDATLDRARSVLSSLLFEIDDIELQINPAIEREYSMKIGCFENDLLRAEIEARRAKRKLALAQAQANRGERIVDEELEANLQAEFARWEAELSERVDAYMRDLEARASSRTLSAKDSHELKTLHRTLIKRLHPDANIGREDECERFFLLAQTAYEQGDLDLMRSIEASSRHLGPSGRAPSNAAEISTEIEIVQARIEVARRKLEAIENSNPYLLKAKLENAAWVTQTVSDLKERTEQNRKARDLYLARYNELKEHCHE